MKEQKKGKKSFSDDLESVFHQTLYEDNLHDNPSMFLSQEKDSNKIIKKTAVQTEAKTDEPGKLAKTSRKSFSDSIDVFFKESIEDALEHTTVTEIKRSVGHNGERKAIGIDVLLQRTSSNPSDFNEASIEPMTKRVTFVVDTEKFETLKTIARTENRHLRNVIAELIEQYVQTHKKPKGKK